MNTESYIVIRKRDGKVLSHTPLRPRHWAPNRNGGNAVLFDSYGEAYRASRHEPTAEVWTWRALRETGTRYTRAALLEAFNVATDTSAHRPVDGGCWKNPIDTVLPAEWSYPAKLDAIREAVIFFTGSVPSFDWETKSTVRVKAAGYYETIGA